MGKIPVDLRKNVATNIRNCRRGRYPLWGGSKMCAADFGVSPQQWSQWERGAHMPDEYRMMEIAEFFGVTTAYLRRENADARGGGGKRAFDSAAASRLEDGIEVPLRVEVERVVYQTNYTVRTERVC